MNLKNFIFFLIILSVGMSCKKECDDPNVENGINTSQLPLATMTGANTMGCLINGEVWLPLSNNILGNLVYDISFSVADPDQGGGGSIQARRDFEEWQEVLNFAIDDVLEEGLYSYPDWAMDYIYVDDNTSCGFYRLDSTYHYNYAEITRIDFENEIVSGTFQMRIVNEICDTLTITEGRFDLSP